MKKITIYDLAELSGVSASAVSAILNGNWKKRRISAKLAEKVTRIAEEQGYAINRQASMLRSKKSHVIGMIVPKYDNRYFGSVAESFEEMARERGLLPIITCTRRRPELEIEAVKAMLSWQVDWVVATGATNPDKITELCQQAGVPTVNLDLPGTLAPSVISDNYAGARALTDKILDNSARRHGRLAPLTFVGGRSSDHNTLERLRGFRDAHQARGLSVPDENVLAPGYSKGKVEACMQARFSTPEEHLQGALRQLDDFAGRGGQMAGAAGINRHRAAADGLLRLGPVCLSSRPRHRYGAAECPGDAGGGVQHY